MHRSHFARCGGPAWLVRAVGYGSNGVDVVVVPGAWDTPAVMDPLLAPLETTGHAAIVVSLPRGDPDATSEDYAAAVQAAFPDDPAGVMLAGYSFGGFTASTIAAEHHQLPLVPDRGLGPAA